MIDVQISRLDWIRIDLRQIFPEKFATIHDAAAAHVK